MKDGTPRYLLCGKLELGARSTYLAALDSCGIGLHVGPIESPIPTCILQIPCHHLHLGAQALPFVGVWSIIDLRIGSAESRITTNIKTTHIIVAIHSAGQRRAVINNTKMRLWHDKTLHAAKSAPDHRIWWDHSNLPRSARQPNMIQSIEHRKERLWICHQGLPNFPSSTERCAPQHNPQDGQGPRYFVQMRQHLVAPCRH